MTPAPGTPEYTARRLWTMYALAALAFLPVLPLHYVGEEAIFPLISLEMWQRGEWVQQILLGGNPRHNPLFNWIIIALCQLTGWEHVSAAARAVTIAATVGSGLVLGLLARRLTGDPAFAALSALVYLMIADVALYRGWVAYVDPLFGFFVFSAIACLWIACASRSVGLLALAAAALVAAFLAKAQTAYVFYGIAAGVLAWDRDARRFLLSPASLALHAAALAAIPAWYGIVPEGGNQGVRMFREILDKLSPTGLLDYAAKLVLYPAQTFAKLLPAAALGAWYAWHRRNGLPASPAWLRTAAAIAALNFLPYWLAPQSHTRYLLPIYPLAALACAYFIWTARPGALAVTARWFWALLAVKVVLASAVFPYYQRSYRGENYAEAARAILERTAGHPLYTTNDSASGLSVAANIAVLRLPAPAITMPPERWESGFVISYTPDEKAGRVVERYPLGGNVLYLLCRGDACLGAGRQPPVASPK